MKLLFTILFFTASLTLFSQNKILFTNKQDSIEHIISLIEKDGMVTSSGTGFVGLPSEQYYRFAFLLTLIGNDELIELVKKSTGCLRVYAYMGLFHNKYYNLKEIEKNLENDTTIIPTESGCVFENVSVKNMIPKITHWYWEFQTNQIINLIKTNEQFRNERFKKIMTSTTNN